MPESDLEDSTCSDPKGLAVANRGDILAVIAAGGALGSLARWGLAQMLPQPDTAFPWATFDANVSGCFALGVLMVFVTDVWPPSRYLRPFLGVGVLGGFTTFSTSMLDTRALLVSGHTGLAGSYVLASLVCGLAAVWIGIVGVRTLLVLAHRRAEHRRRRAADLQTSSRRTGPPPTFLSPVPVTDGPEQNPSPRTTTSRSTTTRSPQ